MGAADAATLSDPLDDAGHDKHPGEEMNASRLLRLLGWAMAALLAPSAHAQIDPAQSYPAKPIRVIAVYEDLSGGLLAGQLQQACPENFVEGLIVSRPASLPRLLSFSRRPDAVDELLQDPARLTDELAWAVRGQAKSDFGLALHAIPDPGEKTLNMAKGRTFIAITNGQAVRNRSDTIAGKSQPDRARMSLNALDLVRLALIEGMG